MDDSSVNFREQNRILERIYERLGNIYNDMPSESDVKTESLESTVFEMKEYLQNIDLKLDTLIDLLESR